MSDLSVLIPNYNHAHYLPFALESVMAQDIQPREVIVMDDASTDNSLEVLEHFAARMPNLRIVRNDVNCGVSRNCNRLLEMAASDILHFMAADDVALPGFYRRCVDMLVRYPQAGMCYALCRQIDENGNDIGLCGNFIPGDSARFVPPEETMELLSRNFYLIGGVARLYRREKVIELGGFREYLKFYSDGLLDHVNMARHGVCFVPEVLACWRIVRTSLSHAAWDDDAQLAGVFRLACETMEREFGGILPREFIRNYKYLALSRLALDKWHQATSRRDQFMDFAWTHLFPERNRLDRTFNRLMRSLVRLEHAAVATYLRLRTRS
jgi:glycosyltransferase involved in cell wall biosynthesis